VLALAMPKDPLQQLARTARGAKATEGPPDHLLRGAVGNARQARDAAAQGASVRDEMLQHIRARLGTLDEVQQRELALCGPRAQRDWWKEVADQHKTATTKPKPKRWQEAARLYGEAANAAARGDLRRAAGLLRAATEAERRAFDQLTDLVQTADLTSDPDNPWKDGVIPYPTPAIATPADLTATCGRILGVQVEVDDPPVKDLILPPAPEVEGEEEEEDEDAAGGG
jgi:hypothetical protein